MFVFLYIISYYPNIFIISSFPPSLLSVRSILFSNEQSELFPACLPAAPKHDMVVLSVSGNNAFFITGKLCRTK